MERVIKAHTPLPPEQLKFRGMHGHETLSQLFEFDVELVSDSHSLDMKQLLGKPITLEIETSGAKPRFLNGQVTRCVLVGREGATARHYIYRATLRPWLWYLTQTSDNKIFQNQSVPDVIEEVLGDYAFPYELKLSDSYRNWEYCVQYQETDFAFLSRLMEHEGIYYWFKHEDGKHTLMVTDDVTQHDKLPGYETLPYYGPDRAAVPQEEYVSSWEVSEQITPGAFATNDYHFKTPGAMLEARRNNPGAYDNGDLEVYEWQGGYTNAGDAERYTRVRLEDLQSRQEQVAGTCNVRGAAPGYLFTLRNHPRQAENREYLVVGAHYRIREGGYASGSGSSSLFDVGFIVLPSSVPYRAPRVTPMPHTHGPQTAKVVGKEGEEIWTDNYGRVKVQFHWDRVGQRNENSSCWVRVSSPWAGGGFGGIQLPRVGDEVIVDFIGGHPDRPIIIGRVYNAGNMPPWELPGNATQSGFLSRTKEGTPRTANAFMFEDKTGQEEIWMHAERNYRTEIELDESHSTDRHRLTNIGHNDTCYVGGKREIHVTGPDVLTVAKTRDVSVTGHENYTVQASRKTEVKDGLNEEIYGKGLKTTVSAVGETREVTGPFKETLKDTEAREVTGLLDETYKGGELRKITKGSTVNIKDGQTVTVETGNAARNVSAGTLTEKVSGQIRIESTGAGMDITSPQTITINSGVDVVLQGKKVKDLSTKSWLKATPFGLNLTVAQATIGLANAAVWRSTLTTAMTTGAIAMIKNDVALMSFKVAGTEYRNKGMETENVGVRTALAGLWVLI